MRFELRATQPAPVEEPDSLAPVRTLATPGDTSWFTHARFGLFIHWGLYSLPARHEWVRHTEQIIQMKRYEKYFKRFRSRFIRSQRPGPTPLPARG